MHAWNRADTCLPVVEMSSVVRIEARAAIP